MLFRNHPHSASDLAAAGARRALRTVFGLALALAGCSGESPPGCVDCDTCFPSES